MSLKLIIALDFHTKHEALQLVEDLDPKHCALKIGNEMFTLFGPEFVRVLIKKNFKIFLDLKFHDIPTTVSRACAACADLGVWMINIHAMGGVQMMEAARNALEIYGSQRPKLIAVTVLTSQNNSNLIEIGIDRTCNDQANILADLACKSGLDGVVCSVQEVKLIKQTCGKQFLTVTPGIRFSDDSNMPNDQLRIATPKEAKVVGSDYIVVGRPITRALNPNEVINNILSDCI